MCTSLKSRVSKTLTYIGACFDSQAVRTCVCMQWQVFRADLRASSSCIELDMVLGVCVEVLYSRSYDGAHIAPTELIVGRFGGSNTKEQGLEHLKSGESVPQRFKMK